MLQASRPDGELLAGEQLVGATISLPSQGQPLQLRIDALEADPVVPGAVLYELSFRTAAGTWQDLCQPDAKGRRGAIVLPGYTDTSGQFVPDAGRFSLTCAGGAQGKCLLAGYRFAEEAGGINHAQLQRFQACARMLRADYCGDGRSWTEDGTLVDLYDDASIQSPQKDSNLKFEAGWSPLGAVCVHHTRVTSRLKLQNIAQHCPRLARKPLGKRCTQDWARTQGAAVIYNKSRQRN